MAISRITILLLLSICVKPVGAQKVEAGCAHIVNECEQKFDSIRDQHAAIISDLNNGLYCSECGQSKTKIESIQNENFEAHIKKVGGKIVKAPQHLIDRENSRYKGVYSALKSTCDSRLTRCNDEVQRIREEEKAKLENLRKQKEEEEKRLQQKSSADKDKAGPAVTHASKDSTAKTQDSTVTITIYVPPPPVDPLVAEKEAFLEEIQKRSADLKNQVDDFKIIKTNEAPSGEIKSIIKDQTRISTPRIDEVSESMFEESDPNSLSGVESLTQPGLKGFSYFGVYDQIKLYTLLDPENFVLYIKYKNDSPDNFKGIVTIEWFEPDGTLCGRESQKFKAASGISGGRAEGDFYGAHYKCQTAKSRLNYSIKLSEVERY